MRVCVGLMISDVYLISLLLIGQQGW
jgi:hypothetical protein